MVTHGILTESISMLCEDNVTTPMVCFGARRFTHQRYRVPLPGDAVIVRKSFYLIYLYKGVHIAYCS